MSTFIRPITVLLAVASLAACGGSGAGPSTATGPTGAGTGGTGGTGGAANGGSPTITASSTPAGGGAYGSGGGNYYFSPTPDTVAAGSTVTFRFGSVTHNVHFDSGPALPDSIPASMNTSVARNFPSKGTVTYHCSIHNFSGVLVLR